MLESKDFFERARKQIHLDKNKDELEAIRRRLHTHTQSLETALQMVNMSVAHPNKHSDIEMLTSY